MEDHVYSLFEEIEESNTVEEDIASSLMVNNSDDLLIDLVKSYPHLYNKKSPCYKDSAMKENSWKEISNVLHMSGKNMYQCI